MLGPFATRKDLVIMSDREKGLDIGNDAEILAPLQVSSDEADGGIMAESPIILPLRRSQRQRGL